MISHDELDYHNDRYNLTTENGVRYYIIDGKRSQMSWPNIFVDCMQCAREIGMYVRNGTLEGGDVERVTDAMATTIFQNAGWVVDLTTKPKTILCPLCKSIPVEEML